MRAVAALQAASPGIDWRYQIIGDGPQLEPLRRPRRRTRDRRDRVKFHGALRTPGQGLSFARACLPVPSVTAADGDVEGVPVALMEAMAAGLIAVSTFHSGIPELIEDRRTGFLAPEKDVGALAAHLIWIAENPRAAEPITLLPASISKPSSTIRS